MTRKKRRLTIIGLALGIFGTAVGISLYALRDTIVFFYGPTEYAQKAPAPGTRLRIGGLVEAGSFKREGQGRVIFAVTDTKHDIRVTYTGLLPDLFREARVPLSRVSSAAMACSPPTACWPSTTSATCPRRSPTP